jgi:hypothetical protein
MKFRTSAFDADVRRLSAQEFLLFRKTVLERFAPAAERVAEVPGTRWPRALRVRNVEGVAGVWEMTWDWPDGRATFEWIEIGGKPAILWRRVGGHEIFRQPAR